MMSFDEQTSRLEARADAERVLWRAELLVEDCRGVHAYRPLARSVGLRGRAGGWPMRVELSADGGLEQVRVLVKPIGVRPLRRVFLRFPGGQGAVPALNTSRTRMLLLPDDGFVEKGVVTLGRSRGTVVSRFLTVLRSPSGSFLAGVGDVSSDFSFFRVDGETLEAGVEPNRAIRKEEQYCLVFGVGDDPLDLLDAYGRHLRPLGRTAARSVTGWNSWDYYGASVTMDDLRTEMAAIKTSPLRSKLTHIVIDMGWWTDWGENQTNRRFPASFRAIAREIEEAGFVPGVWHAPLQCSPWTHLGRHRQELLVKDEDGSAATSGGNAIFDWTQPEVLQILHDWFSALRKAGFRYFKLDYIYSEAVRLMTHRADDSVGLLAMIRNGLKVIRDAVGEDSYILNCGAARECSMGITDASRISTDIHAFWSHIWHNSREIACHLWEQGNLWNIDPDFAIVRSHDTTDDPFPNYIYRRRAWTDRNHFWMAGPEASLSELQVWLTVVHMCGGDVFLSDSIARLNRRGMEALGKLFPRLTSAARPLDLFENPCPRFWLGRSDGLHQLAILNWEDEAAPIVVPRGIDVPSSGTDLWSGKRVAVSERTVMPPRSAYLLNV